MTSSPNPDPDKRPPGGPFAGQKCPVIVGPTAVGKTGLVTSLADRFPIEVISLDSRQIYHGLRIGTAQPTAEELAVCPHHLIDFVSPAEKYDAIRFRKDFETVFAEIKGRGGVPILVGGAGMYLTAVREGFMEIPGNSEERLAGVRAALEPLTDSEVRARLENVDPESFARIHINDRYRSQRALEIFDISGRTMSELKSGQKPDPALGLEFPTFVLERSVAELDKRIAHRTELMLNAGWIEETQTALAKYPANCPGLMSIGYREIVQALQGDWARDKLISAIVLSTRQYAKRQRTWFRNMQCEMTGGPESDALRKAICRLMD
ncbi:MAG: tRNA (adenosine(37)-N6)-dimethylallyltransferase MiaA [Candidatus Krumholzibacteria bacterium]|nr:tRNA (adenosine(37)-N6)-dimethylallyltransferase MiaA [Candidatus Krumholzibacteria bacterium]